MSTDITSGPDSVPDPRREEAETEMRKLVIFTVGDLLLAFPGANVAEILPLTTIYFVPGCPASLEGVINVRGDITSVIRLGDLLGHTHAEGRRGGAILLGQALTSLPPMRSGLRVDRVLDVLDLAAGAIRPPTDTLPVPLRDFASGLFQYGADTVIALDLDALFEHYRRALT